MASTITPKFDPSNVHFGDTISFDYTVDGATDPNSSAHGLISLFSAKDPSRQHQLAEFDFDVQA